MSDLDSLMMHADLANKEARESEAGATGTATPPLDMYPDEEADAWILREAADLLSCPLCADKDLIIAGLRRVNAQLAAECDRMRRLLPTATDNPTAGPSPRETTEGGEG